jgi:hypothetical protein
VATGVLTVTLLVAALAVAAERWQAFESRGLLGIDLRISNVFADRWSTTGSMYLDVQLAGPYAAREFDPDLETLPSLYPPPAVLLFVPFRVLPSFLWWLVPLAAIGWSVARSRPRPMVWPLIGAALVWPNTSSAIIAGNTAMWVAAAVAGGIHLGWPAVAIALKPSFAPFAMAGFLSRPRTFIAGLLVLAVVSLLFLDQWPRYITAALNSDVGLQYSIGDLPLVALPLIAWLGRSGSAKRADARIA